MYGGGKELRPQKKTFTKKKKLKITWSNNTKIWKKKRRKVEVIDPVEYTRNLLGEK